MAKAEWLDDQKDEEIVKLREQLFILKEHFSIMETVIRQLGIEIHELKESVYKSKNKERLVFYEGGKSKFLNK